MTNLPRLVPATQPSLPTASRQLSLAFETIPIPGMLPSDRMKIIRHLASILLQAAGVAERDGDDDEQ